jgi:hypothetical protein
MCSSSRAETCEERRRVADIALELGSDWLTCL